MAAPDPAYGQPKALNSAMALQAFDGVLRTARLKATAAAKKGTDAVLVGPDQQNPRQCPPVVHHRRSSESRLSISDRQPHPSRRAATAPPTGTRDKRKTRSTAGKLGRTVRKASRIRRLSKFRSTARRARRFGMTNPSRAVEPLLRQKRTSKRSPRRRCELFITAANSAGRRSRYSGRKLLPSVTWRGSDAQPLAALGAPCANDGATAAGTHAHQETVSALAPHHGRLICPFHSKSFSAETRDYSFRSGICQAEFCPKPCG
jgi:hypothetical protein